MWITADPSECDEELPECARCTSSNVECPGYVQELKFYDQGIGLRRKFKYDEPPTLEATSKKARVAGTPVARVVLPEDEHIAQPYQIIDLDIQIHDSLRQGDSLRDEAVIDRPSMSESEAVKHTESAGPLMEQPSKSVIVSFSTPLTEFQGSPLSGNEISISGTSVEPLAFMSPSTTGSDDTLSRTIYSLFHNSTKVPAPVSPQKGQSLSSRVEISDFETVFLLRHFSEMMGTV